MRNLTAPYLQIFKYWRRTIMNSFMVVNATTLIKQTNYLKDTHYQNALQMK